MSGGFKTLLLVLAFLCLIAFGLYVGIPQPASAPGGGDAGAIVACEKFVRVRLKSPASAEFPIGERKATDLGSNRYTVTGAVDADNSYGATIRNRYNCRVEFTGGENWRLLNLDMWE